MLPKSHLWAQPWFEWCFWLSILLIVIGLFGFVAHYRERTIPLVLIGGAGGAALLRAPVIVLGILGLAAFFTTLYFLSRSQEQSRATALIAPSNVQPGGEPAQPRTQSINPLETAFSAKMVRLADLIYGRDHCCPAKLGTNFQNASSGKG
jgi:hypothetical protein